MYVHPFSCHLFCTWLWVADLMVLLKKHTQLDLNASLIFCNQLLLCNAICKQKLLPHIMRCQYMPPQPLFVAKAHYQTSANTHFRGRNFHQGNSARGCIYFESILRHHRSPMSCLTVARVTSITNS